MKVSLFTVRHVFVEFVEGMESGIRNPESGIPNPECGIRNPFPFVICGKSFRIYNIFFVSLLLKLYNIKQEVSEVFLACSRH